MGSVKIDTEKGARTYAVKYALDSASGVKRLLRDRHHVSSARFTGNYNAADTLIDLHSAINSAGLSERQTEAVAWLYGVGTSIKRAASVMSISEVEAIQCVDSATRKIAEWFNAKGRRETTALYSEVSV